MLAPSDITVNLLIFLTNSVGDSPTIAIPYCAIGRMLSGKHDSRVMRLASRGTSRTRYNLARTSTTPGSAPLFQSLGIRSWVPMGGAGGGYVTVAGGVDTILDLCYH